MEQLEQPEISAFDWQRIFMDQYPAAFLLEVLFRAFIIFIVVMISLRITGKRGLKQGHFVMKYIERENFSPEEICMELRIRSVGAYMLAPGAAILKNPRGRVRSNAHDAGIIFA